MRIYNKETQQQAVKFPYLDGADAKYRVFPSFRFRTDKGSRNRLQDEFGFDTIEQAAEFLTRFPGSAIRMMPDRAIINRNIVIDIDGQEPAPAEEFADDTTEED